MRNSPEKEREYDQQYYAANRERILAQKREYYLKVKDRRRAYCRTYDANRREEKRDYNYRYYRKTRKLRIFCEYRSRAKKKGIDFAIDEETFRVLMMRPCTYCGRKPKRDCNGLDRVDNSKGYTLDNVVPCCRLCNWTKRNLDLGEFICHVKKIHAHLMKTVLNF